MKSQQNNALFTIKRIIIASIVIQFFLFLTSCSPDPEYIPIDKQVGALPTSAIDPIDNPRTPEKIELGRMLFWDPILSGARDMACVTCHHPDKGYTDRIDLSLGIGGNGLGENRKGGLLIKRNSPTILNAAFNGITESGHYDPANTVMFWDNRAASLEEQSLGPIKDMKEMRGDAYPPELAIDSVSARLANIPEYVNMFNASFGNGTVINGDKIAKAIAAFERTLIAPNSRFDQYARGDESALTEEEIRGFNAFNQANCTACHSGPMFSDFKLHDIGVPDNPKLTEIDTGVDGKYRTPTLRNLSETGPFMHNGMFTTLPEAVRFYNRFERNDEQAQQVNFNGDLIAPIVAFIKTLDDPNFDKTVPESVPSGLPVGGNIQE
ncbi:Cytochrome c peroxidase [Tenacibaculum sp. 190524A02b]|uniref:cytochrome-c peroxidase n=1 Tax=Tenacibaculum vairaonense TaxID=3137860 RepID=UPI0032B21067